MKVKAIIFDWDQTLVHTEMPIIESLNKILKKYNKEPWDIIKNKYFDKSKPIKDNFINFFNKDATQAYQDYLDEYIKTNIKKVVPMEFAKDFIELCALQNIDLFIVSSKEKALLLEEIKLCYPNIHFKKILGHGDTKKNKPSPDPVFYALKDVNYPINQDTVWLIGDSKQDTECAYNSGIQPVLLGKGYLMENDYITKKQNSAPPLLAFSNFLEIKKQLFGKNPIKSLRK